MDGEPGRKRLPHYIPLWVDPSTETYFITICCVPRHLNQLCHWDIAEPLFQTLQYRNDQGIWFVRLCLLMPDHVHLIVTFPPSAVPMRKVVSHWKAWTAKQLRIRWQRDFFEHRLRKEESLRGKADYMLENPVRAGLSTHANDWPFVWIPKES